MTPLESNNIVMTITGSDGTGEAGVQADIRTITSLGARAVSAITSITDQNTMGIIHFYDLPPQVVRGQMEALLADVRPSVVKVGMVRRKEVLTALCELLQHFQPLHVVYHPVAQSSRGEQIMESSLAQHIHQQLLPLCTTIVARPTDLAWLGCSTTDPRLVVLHTQSLHGQDNALSAALAAFLSQGVEQNEAAERARQFVRGITMKAQPLQGRGPEIYNDFVDLVERHFLRHTDVKFYADQLHVTSRYLAQLTRRIAQQSPKDIIDEQMGQHLRGQLTNTSLTVQQIALHSGFSSQAQLSRFFRKLTGLSPIAFRRQALTAPHQERQS